MPLQRRTFLKTMALSAFGAALKPLAFADSQVNYYNFFIHGLFFLEAKKLDSGKWVLEIKAPKVSGHVLLGGPRKNLGKLTDMDFTTNSGLPDNYAPTYDPSHPENPIPTDIKPSILQFTKDETKVGNLAPYDPSLYLGRILLPWPKEFFSLRADNFPYITAGKSVVADKIKGRCRDSKIGTVTCLQYPYNLPGAYHIQLLACDYENVCHVNQALIEAKSIFKTPANFDFYIPSEMGATSTDDPSVPGAVREDENSEKEDEPATWQRWCQNVIIPHAPCDCPPGKICPENVSPANCPLFFVG
jgi:hypothetical protein